MPNKKLSIILVTYNSAKIIFQSLSRLNFDKYDIFVVDNASIDDTPEIVEKNFPKAKIIKLTKNVGYGNGNNAALNLVNSEFALILNPDAMIFDDDIAKIIDAMEKDQGIAIAGPMVLDKYPFDQKEYDEKIIKINQDLNGIRDNYYEKIDNGYSVRFVIGCASFMRMSIFKKIGFFDKNIFLYYEDDELCRRVVKNGYKNAIISDALAFHVGGGGASSTIKLRDVYRKGWHLKGWAKSYWKSLCKGKLRAKRSAAKFVFVYFVKTIFAIFKFDLKEVAFNFGACIGSFSFLIGFEAFNKDGSPRG